MFKKDNEMIKEIYKELDLFVEYQKYKIDIIANDPERWCFTSKYELPTFEYFKQNCINDKGGKYDFTQRRYKTYQTTLENINRVSYQNRFLNNTNIYRHFEYSIWMGTPFNFKEVINYGKT